MTTQATNSPPAKNNNTPADAVTPPRALSAAALDEIGKLTPTFSGITAGVKAKCYGTVNTEVKNYCANHNYIFEKDWREGITQKKSDSWKTWRGRNAAAVEAAKPKFAKPPKAKKEVGENKDEDNALLDAHEFNFTTQNSPPSSATNHTPVIEYTEDEIIATFLWKLSVEKNDETTQGFNNMAVAAEGNPTSILDKFNASNPGKIASLKAGALKAHKDKALDVASFQAYVRELLKKRSPGEPFLGAISAEVENMFNRAKLRFPVEMKDLSLTTGDYPRLLSSLVASCFNEEKNITEAKATDAYQVKLKKLREVILFCASQVVGVCSSGIMFVNYAAYLHQLITSESIVNGNGRSRALYARIKGKFRYASDTLCHQVAYLINTGLVRVEIACNEREIPFDAFLTAISPANLAKPSSLEHLTQTYSGAAASLIKTLIVCGCLFDNNGRFSLRDDYDRLDITEEIQMWYITIENFIGERPNQDSRHFAQDMLKENGFALNAKKFQFAPALVNLFKWTGVAGKVDAYSWRSHPEVVELHRQDQQRRMGAGQEDAALNVFSIAGRREREPSVDSSDKGEPSRPKNGGDRRQRQIYCSFHKAWGTHTTEDCQKRRAAENQVPPKKNPPAAGSLNKATTTQQGGHAKPGTKNVKK